MRKAFVTVDYEPSAEEFDTLVAFIGGCQQCVEDFRKAYENNTKESHIEFSRTLNALLEVAADLKSVSDRAKREVVDALNKKAGEA